MNKTDKIFVAGHTGLIGSAVVRRLQSEGFGNLLLASHADLELTDGIQASRMVPRGSCSTAVGCAPLAGNLPWILKKDSKARTSGISTMH